MGPIASGTSVDPTSQVCLSTMLVLSIVGNQNVQFWGSPQRHNVHTKFHPNLSSGSKVKSCRQTGMTSLICIHFMHNMQRRHIKGWFLKINGVTSMWIMNYAQWKTYMNWSGTIHKMRKIHWIFLEIKRSSTKFSAINMGVICMHVKYGTSFDSLS
jgi:hypothetical protein